MNDDDGGDEDDDDYDDDDDDAGEGDDDRCSTTKQNTRCVCHAVLLLLQMHATMRACHKLLLSIL